MKYVIMVLMLFINEGYIFSQWSSQISNTSSDLNSVYFINNQLGWITCDNGSILRTVNGGENWSSYVVEDDNPLISIFFNTEGIGFALSSNKVYKSSDWGNTWLEFLEYPGYYLYDIYFINDNIGFILLSPKRILKTVDAGNTWKEIIVDPNYNFNKLFFKDETTGWASVAEGTNYYGSIYKTTDCGESWSKIYSSNDRLFEITGFPDSDTLFCVGSSFIHIPVSSKLLISVDGGNNWTSIPTTTRPEIINFRSPNNGHVLGGFGYSIMNQKIISTKDGGNSWLTEDSTTTGEFLTSWYFTSDKEGWAVGFSGLIKKYYNLTYINENEYPILVNYQLMQNFPNPFNPTTNISYSIPKPSFVSIIILDILGREIKKIVNEYKSSGNYTLEFNADGLSSGIYFYQIRTDEFTQTKKMILLR